MNRPRTTLFSLASLVLVLDQLSKYFVRENMVPAQSISVIGEFFHVTYVRNLGAAYGLLPGRQEIFIVTAILSLIGILVFVFVWRPSDSLTVFGLGLAVGGTLGNLIDRVMAGRVTDFLDFFGRHFPVFNVADSAVVCGVGLLLLRILFWHEPEPDALDSATASSVIGESEDELVIEGARASDAGEKSTDDSSATGEVSA